MLGIQCFISIRLQIANATASDNDKWTMMMAIECTKKTPVDHCRIYRNSVEYAVAAGKNESFAGIIGSAKRTTNTNRMVKNTCFRSRFITSIPNTKLTAYQRQAKRGLSRVAFRGLLGAPGSFLPRLLGEPNC